MTDRLSLATADRLPSGMLHVDASALGVGIVHLGVGAFHRAHQAAIMDETIAATGDSRWGICGVTMRSPRVLEQLAPQDGLYTLVERGDGAAAPRVVGVVREVLSAATDPGAVVERIARADIAVVTVTVTEKGYGIDARTGGLDLTVEGTAGDLAGGEPTTMVGVLVRGLERRFATSGAPMSVLSCDNLPHNGAVLRRLVFDFVGALPDAEPLAAWIASSVTFPSTMVDRITPATTAGDLDDVEELLGLADRGAVVAEPFRQWVVEDDFAGPRPDWEVAGVIMVDDVSPWEAAKLRLLNATHSLLAYTGLALGIGTIAEAVTDPRLRGFAERLQREEVAQTLDAPAGLDVRAYGDTILERFANPALGHTTAQVGGDGSQKLSVRFAETAVGTLAAGRDPLSSALAVAAWVRHVASTPAEDLADPLADRLASALAQLGSSASSASSADVVGAVLGVPGVLPPDLTTGRFPELVVEQYDELDALVAASQE
jgi:fructuronate reductase